MMRKLAMYTTASFLLFFLAATRAYGQGDARPRVAIGHVPEGSSMVDAKMGADGVIHLLFQKDGAPFYATSTDGGATARSAIPVIKAKINPPGLEFLGWDMAVSEKGKVFVVMGNNGWKFKLPADQQGMFLATLEPGAKEFAPMTHLVELPSEGFSIVAGKGPSVTAAYLRGKLYWKHSTDDGKTFSPDSEINKDYLPCSCCTTSLVVGRDGTLAVLYREATDNRRDIYAVLSKDGKESRVRISQTLWEINACPMTYFRIMPAGDGFVAAWPTRGEVYFARFSSTGKLWEPGEIKVGGKTAMRSSVFALAGANDTTLVAWKSDDKLHWRIFDATGKPIGQEAESPGPGSQAGGVVDKQGGYVLFP